MNKLLAGLLSFGTIIYFVSFLSYDLTANLIEISTASIYSLYLTLLFLALPIIAIAINRIHKQA